MSHLFFSNSLCVDLKKYKRKNVNYRERIFLILGFIQHDMENKAPNCRSIIFGGSTWIKICQNGIICQMFSSESSGLLVLSVCTCRFEARCFTSQSGSLHSNFPPFAREGGLGFVMDKMDMWSYSPLDSTTSEGRVFVTLGFNESYHLLGQSPAIQSTVTLPSIYNLQSVSNWV